MDKKTLSLILVICMLFSLVACSSENSFQATDKEDVIKIAHIGPLTGDGEPWGTSEINAINMFVEELNENGGILGKKVQIYSYDNRFDNVETTNAARKAINNWN